MSLLTLVGHIDHLYDYSTDGKYPQRKSPRLHVSLMMFMLIFCLALCFSYSSSSHMCVYDTDVFNRSTLKF